MSQPIHVRPAWVGPAVVYGVIPRNFGTPSLKAVAAKLDSLRDLGVDALWLAPINASPPGDYGYAVTDYFELRPDAGTKADFKALVAAAHVRNIRVLMDFVPNHTSDQHRYFQDALRHGRASPYHTFYDRDASGNPTHYFSWTHLPNLNYSNPDVERWMLDAFSYWVREFDIDGFRVDAAWGIKERKPDFWPRWREELKRLKPDLLLLAEASARDPYYFANGFDAAYDWSDRLGQWAWTDVFTGAAPISRALRTALTNADTGYPADALVFRFLNNNDTGDRFITRHGVDLYRVATALLLTLPGLPCLYTGDEVGAEFQPYAQSGPISWDDRHGLRDDIKRLIALRKGTPSLHSLQWQAVTVSSGDQVFGYIRSGAVGDRPALILLNFTNQSADTLVDVPKPFAGFAEGSVLDDLLTGDQVATGPAGQLRVALPAWGVRVLAAAKG